MCTSSELVPAFGGKLAYLADLYELKQHLYA